MSKRKSKKPSVVKERNPPIVAVPKITLDAFRRTSGIRPVHFAGFARYITLRCGTDTSLWDTVAGWKNAYDEYLNKPVVG